MADQTSGERAVHVLSRELQGSAVRFPLPLCWDAEACHRHGSDYDVEDWWTAWDQGALDPTHLVFATSAPHVTCADCLAWVHA